jgi:hypothetical protein
LACLLKIAELPFDKLAVQAPCSERAALAPSVAKVADAGDVFGIGGKFQEVLFIHGGQRQLLRKTYQFIPANYRSQRKEEAANWP